MIFVYAIRSLSKNYIYVGQTNHVIKRFHQHNQGKEKTTKPFRPFELIYTSSHPDRSSARVAEKYLKTAAGKKWLRKLIK
jgi:putative endonuclease